MLLTKPFTKWGIDYIGPMKLTRRYIGIHYEYGWRARKLNQYFWGMTF